MNKPDESLLYSALVVVAIGGSFFSPFISIANGQSPMGNDNETGMNQNMSRVGLKRYLQYVITLFILNYDSPCLEQKLIMVS
jgi:hypothetical protein